MKIIHYKISSSKFKNITPIERKIIPSLNCFSDNEAIREFPEPAVKIPLNPPLQKGDDGGFLPFSKVGTT